tara:strand:+ start:138 stop:995 length:858 start_codon:yes stop_codon:yes gene_type:complete
MFKDTFAALILTHNRPNQQKTIKTLRRLNYTGKIYLVCDDEDPSLDEYIKMYSDQVLVFSKKEIAEKMDVGNNFEGLKGVVYARNAAHDLAKKAGLTHFIELDDDYAGFYWKNNSKKVYTTPILMRNLDNVFERIVDYLESTPFKTICMAQGGDFIGGFYGQHGGRITLLRKAMNSFVCAVDRPFQFMGAINEDVNAYVSLGNRGDLFATLTQISLNQMTTQAQSGGLTEIYLDAGTYVKSFYTVMYSPSCTKIAQIGTLHPRLHHRVKWENAVPKIIGEEYRRV